jgi:hypothetical protein
MWCVYRQCSFCGASGNVYQMSGWCQVHTNVMPSSLDAGTVEAEMLQQLISAWSLASPSIRPLNTPASASASSSVWQPLYLKRLHRQVLGVFISNVVGEFELQPASPICYSCESSLSSTSSTATAGVTMSVAELRVAERCLRIVCVKCSHSFCGKCCTPNATRFGAPACGTCSQTLLDTQLATITAVQRMLLKCGY